jgi:hypothetical protein
LDCQASERKVLITETLFNTKQAREKTAQMMFEEFNSPAVMFALQGLLSLYSVEGRLSGIHWYTPFMKRTQQILTAQPSIFLWRSKCQTATCMENLTFLWMTRESDG